MPSWSVEYVVPVRRLGPLLALFALIGVAFLVAGLWLGMSRMTFLKNAIEVPGEVTALERQRGGAAFYPVVRYSDKNGHERRLYASSGSNPPGFFEGQKVTVLYVPTDPEFPLHASIKSVGQLWFGTIFLTCFGSVWLLFTSVFWFASRPKAPSKKPRVKRVPG